MGVLPNVPQLSTGDSKFDHEYAVFAGSDERTGNIGFRNGPVAPALGWVNAAVIQQLVNFDLCWARVQKGRCELALAPIRPKHASGAIALASGFAAGGQDQPRVPRGDLRDERTPSRAPLAPLSAAGWLSIPVSAVGALGLGVWSPMRDLTSTELCGPGDRIVVVEYGDSSYTLACAQDRWRDLTLHFVTSGALLLSLLWAICAVRSVWIFIRSRQKESLQ